MAVSQNSGTPLTSSGTLYRKNQNYIKINRVLLFTWLRQICFLLFLVVFFLFIIVITQLPFAFVVRRLILSTNNIRPLKNHFPNYLSSKLSRDYLGLDFSILAGEFALERVDFFVELRLHFQTVDLKNINMPRDRCT